MIQNYCKIAFRNLQRNWGFAFINIVGLAIGMAIAMLIGLWIWDESSHDTYHTQYPRLAQVMQHQHWNGQIGSQTAIPLPLADALRKDYAHDFEAVALSSWTFDHIIATGEKKISTKGNFVEPIFPQLLSLKIKQGSIDALKDPSSMLLNESLAKTLFGSAENALHKMVKIDNKSQLKIGGIYEDLPHNTTFNEVSCLFSWTFYEAEQSWIKEARTQWNNNSFQLFVMIRPEGNFETISRRIRWVKFNVDKQDPTKPEVFLHPMSRWHLYSEFKDGKNIGGRIQFVWLFGIIGLFVLLLACINFMNLSTARSEKRAKEVGVRKAIGSGREQLIAQFLSESLLITLLAFIVCLIVVELTLPFFNQLASKQVHILWTNAYFWLMTLGFLLFTGLISGSYPAFYLSSFEPIQVLKGTFRVGKWAALPRKVLVILQFTVSVTLIIGTIVVYRQIIHAKNRPVGYDRAGLISINMNTPEIRGHYDVLRNDVLKTGVVYDMAESLSPTTGVYSNQIGFDWEKKDPNLQALFSILPITHDYGRTVGWQLAAGRDFSRSFSTDTAAVILNQACADFIGFKNPIGKNLKWNDRNYRIIGVIKNMVMESPFTPVRPAIFFLAYDWTQTITIRIKPDVSASEALSKLEVVFKKHNPGSPFVYQFNDEDYARKFESEERIGQLAGVFAVLAIFISCLGIFGLASFVAEQRTKEIGVRKVLGATVWQLWRLLSKDFVVLVLISFVLACPLAYFYMNDWLKSYEYRTEITWWIFVLAGIGALGITLLTVSYQAIKAATANPVKSLRTE